MRFPPVLPRGQFETSGYLKSFPHLAGAIFGFGGTEAQALEQYERASRHEDWSEYQADDRAGPGAGRLLPDLSGRGGARTAGAGRRHDRSGRLVRLSARAVGRPGPATDVPPARARRMGEPRDRRRVAATMVASARSNLLRDSASTAGYDVAADPFFGRSGRMLAASQRAHRRSSSRSCVADRRADADRGRLLQLPPGTYFATMHRADPGRRRSRPHGLSGLRARADRARRCCRTHGLDVGVVAGRGPTGALGVSTSRPCGSMSLFGHDPATYRPHAVHAGGQTYHETNCYTDILDRGCSTRTATSHSPRLAPRSAWTSRATSGRSSSPIPVTWNSCSASTSTRCSRTGRCRSRSRSSSANDEPSPSSWTPGICPTRRPRAIAAST